MSTAKKTTMTDQLLKIMNPMADLMNKSKHLKAVRDSFILILPFTLVGSILTAIATLPYIEKILSPSIVSVISTFVAPSSTYSSGIIGFFVSIGIGYFLSQQYEVNPINGAMISMVNFLMQIPFVLTTAGGEEISNAVSLSNFGPNATFTAIIMGILSIEIYRRVLQKNWTIKLPDSVPPMIAESFTCFIPATLAMLFGLAVNYIFSLTSFGTMTNFIFSLVQKPLSGLGTSFIATVIVGIINNLFWFLGLHGQSLVFGTMSAFWAPLNAENVAAMAAGQPLPNLMSSSFVGSNITLGGWIAVPMLIAIFVYRKRKDWNELGKLALIPGIFNIYEPLMFGFPLVLNPMTLIPMILTPVITTSIMWFVMKIGLVPYCTGVILPGTTPLGLVGLLTTNSIMGGLIQLLIIPILAVMWYFILKAIDKSEQHAQEVEAVEGK